MWIKTKSLLALIDIRSLSFAENFLIVRIRDITKISTKKFHIEERKFPRYQENEKVCVFTCMKEYLKLTENVRTSCLKNCYKTATQNTLTRWIKDTLHLVGINMSIFSPHSTTRSTATSHFREEGSRSGWEELCGKACEYEENFTNSILP